MFNLSLLAMASPPEGAGGSSALLLQIMPIALIFLVFWFMIIRPQKKTQDQRKTMLGALKRGDKIITNGGLFATIKDVKSDRVVATIAEGVKVEVSRQSVSAVLAED
ncbi:MAG: preprotein translocase subunit YajC [Gemmatimonadales bacterium]|nr:preprotein translocase subunit YajC [Gemmatimonadales bacterium]